MKRYMVLVAVIILGLITTGFIYYVTDSNRINYSVGEPDSISSGLCPSQPLSTNNDSCNCYFEAKINLSAGLPLVSHTATNTCGAETNVTTLEAYRAYLSTWQFYANLLIWSSAWFAVYFIVNKFKPKKI